MIVQEILVVFVVGRLFIEFGEENGCGNVGRKFKNLFTSQRFALRVELDLAERNIFKTFALEASRPEREEKL